MSSSTAFPGGGSYSEPHSGGSVYSDLDHVSFYILTLTLLSGTFSPKFTHKKDEKFYSVYRRGQCSLCLVVEGQSIPVTFPQVYQFTLQLTSLCTEIIVELRHEISTNVVGGTSKGSDQPGQRRSLIRVFASRLNIL